MNAELIFEKLYLIRKLKFRNFNSMAVISYLSFRMLPYFQVKQVLNRKNNSSKNSLMYSM